MYLVQFYLMGEKKPKQNNLEVKEKTKIHRYLCLLILGRVGLFALPSQIKLSSIKFSVWHWLFYKSNDVASKTKPA